MTFLRWLFPECTGCKQLKNAQAETQEALDRVARAMDNLELDMSALYDKVKSALARISTREARANAAPPPDGGNGRVGVEEINQMILDGTYDNS